MNALRMTAVALVVVGVLALAYGGFSYTQDTQQAKIGPLELSVKESRRVNIPIWVGIAAIASGIGLVLIRR